MRRYCRSWSGIWLRASGRDPAAGAANPFELTHAAYLGVGGESRRQNSPQYQSHKARRGPPRSREPWGEERAAEDHREGDRDQDAHHPPKVHVESHNCEKHRGGHPVDETAVDHGPVREDRQRGRRDPREYHHEAGVHDVERAAAPSVHGHVDQPSAQEPGEPHSQAAKACSDPQQGPRPGRRSRVRRA